MSTAAGRRLTEHRDFQQLVTLVADHQGLLPAWIEKDYWVVRVLDALVRTQGLAGRFVFKGGTSLSKAWKLIDRFSEDVDLLLTGPDYGPMPKSSGERKQLFKAVRIAIEEETPLRLPLDGLSEAQKQRYYFRAKTHGHLLYPLQNGPLSATASSQEWLLVEAGFRGGAQPWTSVSIRSYLGEYLAERPTLADTARQHAPDVEPIEVPVLGAERTFAEKLLAVHTAAVAAASGDQSRLQVRHYYDLAKLYRGHGDVQRCLEQPQVLVALLSESIEVSKAHWGASLSLELQDLDRSPALDPPPELRRLLEDRWRVEAVLYPHGQPPLAEVLETVGEIRTKLAMIDPPSTPGAVPER